MGHRHRGDTRSRANPNCRSRNMVDRHNIALLNSRRGALLVVIGVRTDMGQNARSDAVDPKRTFGGWHCCDAQRPSFNVVGCRLGSKGAP